MSARSARWFRLEDDRQVGPVDLEEMRRQVRTGQLGPDEYVWADGMPEWLPARKVPALIPPPSLAADLPAWEPVTS